MATLTPSLPGKPYAAPYELLYCSGCISQPPQAVGLLLRPLKGLSALSAAKEPAPQAAPLPPIYSRACNMMSHEAVLPIYRGQPVR